MRIRTFRHARGRLLRLGVTGTVLAVASIASLSGSALASPTAVSPTLATAAARSGPQVTVDRARGAADSSKWLTPAVRAKIAKAGIAAATAGPSVAVAFSGFAWCGEEVVVQWPAYDSTHDQTMTVPALIFAATPDFANAQVEIADWFFSQVGTDFTVFFLDGVTPPVGPFVYQDAWTEWSFDPPANQYVRAVNVIFTVDGGVTAGPDVQFVQAVGPNVTTSPTCRL